MNPKIDLYLAQGCGRCKLGGTPDCKVHSWQEELKQLRNILLDSELTEDLKWRIPCYTFQDKNIVLLTAFNDYCALSFFKGVLLKDTAGILIQQTENSQSARLIRFTNVDEIIEMEHILKDYIAEAIEVEKSGLVVTRKETSEFDFPDELQEKFDENPEFELAFEALTPGRQRGFLLHFSGAKQSKTRTARIEKCMDQIFAGKGFNER